MTGAVEECLWPRSPVRTPFTRVGASCDGRHPRWLGYQDSNLN